MPFISANPGYKLALPYKDGFVYDDILAWHIDDDGVLAVTLHGLESADSIAVVRAPDGMFYRRVEGRFATEDIAREWCTEEKERRAAANRAVRKVFVKFDSLQWRAWAKHRKAGMPQPGITGGWWFESEWPPEPAPAAAPP